MRKAVGIKTSYIHCWTLTPAHAETGRTLALLARKRMTHVQDQQKATYLDLTQNSSVAINFCNPDRPWERVNSEIINGLIRKLLPKEAKSNWMSHLSDKKDRTGCDRLKSRQSYWKCICCDSFNSKAVLHSDPATTNINS